MLLYLLGFMAVVSAAPEPRITLEQGPPGFAGRSSGAAPNPIAPFAFDDRVSAEVWGQGRIQWRHLRMLLRSAPLRRTFGGPLQLHDRRPGAAHWRLKSSARVLRLPQERRVRLEMRQSSGDMQLAAGLEALDAELAPAAGFHRRLVRRFGPTLAVRYRPHGALGRHALQAFGACARAWPVSPQGPVWDLAAYTNLGWRSQTPWALALWGQAAIRHLAGDKIDALLQGGQFLPHDTLHSGAWSLPARTLRTHVRGFEDTTWYTTRQANVDVGVSVQPAPPVRLELFASAGMHAAPALKAGAPAHDVLQSATGAAVQFNRPMAGYMVSLRYQVAVRHQGSRQPVWHMVTASL